MGTRSRIRWPKVAKLSLAVLGGLALFAGLPSLIRRPEPPPLEPDIGLAPLAASRVPPSGLRPGSGPERRTAKGTDRHRPSADDRRRPGRRPARHEEEPPSTASPATGVPAPAPVPLTAPVPTAAATPPPAPPPPPPTSPPPTRPASQPAAGSEFGFER